MTEGIPGGLAGLDLMEFFRYGLWIVDNLVDKGIGG